MSDPFSEKHAKDERSAEQAKRTQDVKAATAQIQARLTAQKTQAARPANWDVGHPWPRKFYHPKA